MQVVVIGNEESQEAADLYEKLRKIGINCMWYDTLINARWHEELHFCGCGMPEEVQDYMQRILFAMAERSDSNWEINNVEKMLKDDMAHVFVLYVLDAMGLTEHGGSIFGSWLDPRGRALLKELAVEAKNRHDETNGE